MDGCGFHPRACSRASSMGTGYDHDIAPECFVEIRDREVAMEMCHRGAVYRFIVKQRYRFTKSNRVRGSCREHLRSRPSQSFWRGFGETSKTRQDGFPDCNPARCWLSAEKEQHRSQRPPGITNIGGQYQSALASFSVRPHLTPSVEFATVEVLWLWTFGAALETLLRTDARGNRHRLINDRRDFHKHGLGYFVFWPTAYREFRENGFAVARDLLKKRRSRCLIATFDLASYYDEVDPSFLISATSRRKS